MFNALKYTQELEKAGFTREQAEISMKTLIEVMNENFATKADLKELESKIQALELKMDAKFAAVDVKFEQLEYRLTIKLSAIMGAMMTFLLGATAALIKILPTVGS